MSVFHSLLKICIPKNFVGLSEIFPQFWFAFEVLLKRKWFACSLLCCSVFAFHSHMGTVQCVTLFFLSCYYVACQELKIETIFCYPSLLFRQLQSEDRVIFMPNVSVCLSV